MKKKFATEDSANTDLFGSPRAPLRDVPTPVVIPGPELDPTSGNSE